MDRIPPHFVAARCAGRWLAWMALGLAAAVVLAPSPARALPTQIACASNNPSLTSAQNNCAASGCHTQGTSPLASLAISGPNTVAPGAPADFDVVVTGGLQRRCGFNVSANAGVLTPIQANTRIPEDLVLLNCNPFAATVGEISHASAFDKSGLQAFGAVPAASPDECVYRFRWTAPASPGTATLFAAGISASVPELFGGMGDFSGNDAYAAVTKTISVTNTPVCGNGAVEGTEQCDDGGTVAGDGCSATCSTERFLSLAGLAEGGFIEVTVGGMAVETPTIAGQDPDEVAFSVAQALSNAGLGAAISTLTPGTLWLSTAFTSAVDGDFGLAAQVSPAVVLTTIGLVAGEQKISATQGAFAGPLQATDQFGIATAAIGDLDRDGLNDVAVGAWNDDSAANNAGAAWVLFLQANGAVKTSRKIGPASGDLDVGDVFGGALAGIGDLDADGVPDLAVGADADDDGATNTGAVWILFMNTDGTVKAQRKISATSGGFGSGLGGDDRFGRSIAALGDLDGDGIGDLAVGALLDDDGGSGRGAVWVLFLRRDGTVKAKQKISDTAGGFGGVLDDDDRFGRALAVLGDLDGDSVVDIVTSAVRDDDGDVGDENVGALWVLFLNSDGTVKAQQKISETTGGFDGSLASLDSFGISLASLGDIDRDGIPDLAVGANGDDAGGASTDRGVVWLLLLRSDGTVRAARRVSGGEGGFPNLLAPVDNFGVSLAAVAPPAGDAVGQLAVGAHLDDDGIGDDFGAVWMLFFDGVPLVCGNGVLDPGETCDDGDAASADGCNAFCLSERFLAFSGSADGGFVEVTINGVDVRIDTASGQTPSMVAAALNTALGGAYGFTAVTGGTIWLTGSLTRAAIGDIGLAATASPGVTVPEPDASALGIAVIGAVAALGTRRARSRRSR